MKSHSTYRRALVLVVCGTIAACALAAGALRGMLPAADPAGGSHTPVADVSSADAVPVDRVAVRVTHIVDGDTIDVIAGGERVRVRYIGIDAPESVRPDYPVERMGPEASDANRALVDGKTVYLEGDVSDTDPYGRWLRYVYVGDVFVNAELVRLGLAEARRYPPDLKHQDVLDQMESQARDARRGIWSTGGESDRHANVRGQDAR